MSCRRYLNRVVYTAYRIEGVQGATWSGFEINGIALCAVQGVQAFSASNWKGFFPRGISDGQVSMTISMVFSSAEAAYMEAGVVRSYELASRTWDGHDPQ